MLTTRAIPPQVIQCRSIRRKVRSSSRAHTGEIPSLPAQRHRILRLRAPISPEDVDAVVAAARTLESAVRAALGGATRAEAEAAALLDQADTALAAAEFDQAQALLTRAESLPLTQALEVRAAVARAMLEPWIRGMPQRARDLLVEQAARAEAADPALAAQLLVDAALSSITGDDLDGALALATHAGAVAERAGDSTRAVTALAVDVISTLTGDAAVRAARVEEVLASTAPPDDVNAIMLHRLGALCFWSEDYLNARRIIERAVEAARGGARTLLPVLLNTLAAIDFRTGRWRSAESRSAEALRGALELGQQWQAASCSITLAGIAASTGAADECRRRVDDAFALAPGSRLVAAWAGAVIASLELSLDRPVEAVDALAEDAGAFGTSAVARLPLLVEALVRAGRVEEAHDALATLEADAAASRHLGTLAAAARCRGLVARPSEYRKHFEEAVELHAQLPTPFERARTELCFGERLRRSRRRADAQRVLRSALATFERVGAVRWSERARRELDATRPRRDATALDQLTRHEIEVSALVAGGATNREAAQALFVTPKTIEYHLRNIYAKLGIRSRTELASVMHRLPRPPQASR